jgi:hypothetical protein
VGPGLVAGAPVIGRREAAHSTGAIPAGSRCLTD